MKKYFVCSDIHGHYNELIDALDGAGFDRNNNNHILVCLGDYFDKGSQNLKVLRFMEMLDNKILLRGNHEDMLLKILDNGYMEQHNFFNGTDKTIMEFFGRYAIEYQTGGVDIYSNTRMLDRVCDFINGLSDYYETENYIFTHAWLPLESRSNEKIIMKNWRNASQKDWQGAHWTCWSAVYNYCDIVENKTIICGHDSCSHAYKFNENRKTSDYSIFFGDKIIAVDACTIISGIVNVLVIEDEEIS